MSLSNQRGFALAFSTDRDLATSKSEEVLHRCAGAKQLADFGDFEGARAELGEFWGRIGGVPRLDGLEEVAQAELLLRTGTLSGQIGSAQQIEGAQGVAKDLLFQSSRIFEKLGLNEKVSEAHVDLAVCYWREGALDEARITLNEVLSTADERIGEQRLRAFVTLAIVEVSATRYQDALRIHIEAAPLFDASSNHALKGIFHSQFGMVLRNLGVTEQRPDYIDSAFIELTAGSYHLEEAGHTRYLARAQNNLGYLFLTTGKLIEAHQHLNRARALFVKLKDKGSVAQVDETRARVFLAQGLSAQAEAAVRGSVRILEQGDERSLLAEALITSGTALAQLGRSERAQAQLKRAIDVASQAGDPEQAGIAALTIIEELSSHVSAASIHEHYREAESLLEKSRSAGIAERLGKCARAILMVSKDRPNEVSAVRREPAAAAALREREGNGEATPTAQAWTGCLLENEVLRFEGELIQRALETAGGSVTRAARMLGVTHQGLAFILNGRHKNLLTVRTPVRRRRKSIFRNH
jgi:tetratricopeptide (TPR) repeat protein